MATKEEILRDLKNRGKCITSVSMFYDFKEGDKVVMARPRPDIDLDAEIGEILSGDTELNNLYLTSLLYYRTLKDSAPAERISGILSLDNNLYNENEPQTAKTAASAAFLGKDEVICVREDIFSGSTKDIAFDMICALHESRHYHQMLTKKPYTKTLDGKLIGDVSEKELLEMAVRMFDIKELFFDADKEELERLSYAMYHQQDIEVDARRYSLEESSNIVQKALTNPNLSDEQREKLSQILEEINKEISINDEKNREQAEIYDEVIGRAKEYAAIVQKRVRSVLTDENIAKLEHFDERDPETEYLRQYLFKLEASLYVNYDENLARFIEEISNKYKIFAVGRNMILHPKFVASQELLDRILLGDFGILLFGEPGICPPYEKEAIIDRYAELKSNDPKTFI